jgi:hypothetical protein
MKRILFLGALLLLICCATAVFSQSQTGQICFIRSSGYEASAVNFRVFIDDSLVCKLRNKRYSQHTVSVGEHTVAGRNTGLTIDRGSTPLKVKVEEGKITYISLVLVSNKVSCMEITQNSADVALKKVKEATNCGDKDKAN